MVLLEVKDLTVKIRDGNKTFKVVDNLSFELDAGETLGIVGESGCGKTMSALAIMGLLPASAKVDGGQVFFQGKDLLKLTKQQIVSVRGRQIALVYQNPFTSLNPAYTIKNQLLEGVTSENQAEELLHLVGMSETGRYLKNYPHQLSGGQRQRVTIAMALAGKPKLLIADEPTTGLDVTIQAQILELLREVKQKRKLSLILIGHDLGIVAQNCDRVIVMYAGNQVESGKVDDIFYNARHPYTRGLLNSISRVHNERRTRLRPIAGVPPQLGQMPAGCCFEPRCYHKADICGQAKPALRIYSGNKSKHLVACHVMGEK